MTRYFKTYIEPYLKDKFTHHLSMILPSLWLFIFLIIPFFIIFKISFSESILSLPPISSIISLSDQKILHISLNLQHYITLFTDIFYVQALSSSLYLSFISTIITLVIGFIIAYAIYKTDQRYHYLCIMFIMIPFWTSFLIRVYAWMNMLGTKGLINKILMKIGFIDAPLYLLDNQFAVCLGIVYCYLPFMILPIYASLQKINPSYQEASYDLGASPWQTFWRITIPLSYQGIVAGFILVFMPSIGEFVIPELLGGAETFTIGRVVWLEFFNNLDWPMASALTIIMVIPIIVLILLINRYNDQKINSVYSN